MALAGLHVTCGYMFSRTFVSAGVVRQTADFFEMPGPAWSETLADPGMTTRAAPAYAENSFARSLPAMIIVSAVDAFVATGPSPNALTGPRFFVPARTQVATLVRWGDKLAWTPGFITGLHVVCSIPGTRSPDEGAMIPLAGPGIWSETLASAGVTANAAPVPSLYSGAACFSVRASQDAFISMEAAPNAAVSPRRFLAANSDLDVFVKGGDKLAWIAA